MADANKLKNHILRLKENYMKKTLATVVLASVLVLSSTLAQARDNWLLPLIGGVIIGNVIAQHNNSHRNEVVVIQPTHRQHYRSHRQHYRSHRRWHKQERHYVNNRQRCERHWRTAYDQRGYAYQEWYEVCNRPRRFHN